MKRYPMSKVPQLATGQIIAVDTLIIELGEADETPAVVIIRWPVGPTVLHPRRFPSGADAAVRAFAAALVAMAQIRTDRRLWQSEGSRGPTPSSRSDAALAWSARGTRSYGLSRRTVDGHRTNISPTTGRREEEVLPRD
jgi:hypothetical protein